MALTKVSRGLLTTSIVDNGNATAITIDSSENVLVNTANAGASGLSLSNGSNLSFAEGANSSIVNLFRQTSSAHAFLGSGYRYSSTANKAESSYAGAWARTAIGVGYGVIKFYADAAATVAVGTDITPTERMRIDSSGDLLVGTTVAHLTSSTFSGLTQFAGGHSIQKRSGGTVAYFDRLTNDGEIIQLRRNGVIIGSIGSVSGAYTQFNSMNTGYLSNNGTNEYAWDGTRFYPNTDNTNDLGLSSRRFKDLYRSGSTISTSDRNMKQDIRDLTDAERNVAVAAKGLLKAFRFIDTVEAEGDSASIHFGIIAQDLAAAFTAEGLDANDYQVYRADTFTDDDGDEQTRLGICYENLLAFIISAI